MLPYRPSWMPSLMLPHLPQSILPCCKQMTDHGRLPMRNINFPFWGSPNSGHSTEYYSLILWNRKQIVVYLITFWSSGNPVREHPSMQKRWEFLDQTTVAVFSTRIPCSFGERPLFKLAFFESDASSYAAAWTPRAARPEGSRFFDQDASHSTALAVLHATLGPPGTVDLAAFWF